MGSVLCPCSDAPVQKEHKVVVTILASRCHLKNHRQLMEGRSRRKDLLVGPFDSQGGGLMEVKSLGRWSCR